MAELTTNVNWLAVIIGGVLSFLLGWLWYSPKLFGTKWAAGNNIALPTGDDKMPVAPLLMQVIATFLLAWLIGVTAASHALLTAFLILVTAAMLIAANGAFAKKSSAAIWIETTFVLAMGAVMIITHGVLS